MNALEQMKGGLHRAWTSIEEGWYQLRDIAGNALTRFRLVDKGKSVTEQEIAITQNMPQWGLLMAEVREEARDIVVRLEAPGMDKEDFDISIMDHYLVVKGEKHIEREETKGHYHMTECAYGSFERSIPLPDTVEPEKAKAKYRRGVLSIRLPKTKDQGVHKINVTSG